VAGGGPEGVAFHGSGPKARHARDLGAPRLRVVDQLQVRKS
jgi:hypothetical protein